MITRREAVRLLGSASTGAWFAAISLSTNVSAASSTPPLGDDHKSDDHKNKVQISTLPLDSMDGLEVQGIAEAGADPVKVQAKVASYRGRRAVRIVNDDGPAGTVSGGQVLALVKTSDFKDGTIEAEVAGSPRPGAKPSTRGFIGIAFRSSGPRLAV